MTRPQEILKENYENYFASPKYDKKVNRRMDESWVIPAMNQFAKETSIAFAEWVNARYTWVKDNLWDADDDETYTTDQLFNLFLEHQAKNKWAKGTL